MDGPYDKEPVFFLITYPNSVHFRVLSRNLNKNFGGFLVDLRLSDLYLSFLSEKGSKSEATDTNLASITYNPHPMRIVS